MMRYDIGVLEAQEKRMEREGWSVESNWDAEICMTAVRLLNEEVEDLKGLYEEYRRCRRVGYRDIILDLMKRNRELEGLIPKI